MVQVVLIGISAGAATALLFASVASGSALSVPLFYLAPLPILIAAMGWSHWAALIAAVVAAVGLAAVFGWFFFIAFLIGIGLPAWWLGYLALLARPARGARPAGSSGIRSAIWCSGPRSSARAIVIAGMLTLGSDLDSFRSFVAQQPRTHAQAASRATSPRVPLTPDPSRLIDILVAVLPPAAAVLADHHQRRQSLACRAHREGFGPAAPSAIRSVGHAVSGLCAGADRRSRSRPRSCPASSASRPACSPRAC